MDADERTAGLLRDGLLALVALVGLLDSLRRRGRLDVLRTPGAALAGVVGAVGVEAVLLANPGRTRRLWSRPTVRFASLAVTVVGGRALARRAGRRAAPRMAAALCWGLLAYLVLLGFVL